jgi:hypothetical protein
MSAPTRYIALVHKLSCLLARRVSLQRVAAGLVSSTPLSLTAERLAMTPGMAFIVSIDLLPL